VIPTTAHHWSVRSPMPSAEPAMAPLSTATQPTMPTMFSTSPSPAPVLFLVPRELTGLPPRLPTSRLLSALSATASLPALAALAALAALLLLLLRPPPSPLAASLPALGLATVSEPSAAATMTALMTWSARAASAPTTANSAALDVDIERRCGFS
jgi:hypothetical protein